MADNKVNIDITIATPEHFTEADRQSLKDAVAKWVKGKPLQDAAGQPVDIATVNAQTPNKGIVTPNK